MYTSSSYTVYLEYYQCTHSVSSGNIPSEIYIQLLQAYATRIQRSIGRAVTGINGGFTGTSVFAAAFVSGAGLSLGFTTRLCLGTNFSLLVNPFFPVVCGS